MGLDQWIDLFSERLGILQDRVEHTSDARSDLVISMLRAPRLIFGLLRNHEGPDDDAVMLVPSAEMPWGIAVITQTQSARIQLAFESCM